MLACEACLILKARSYVSRADSRLRAYHSEKVRVRCEHNAWKLLPDGPFGHRHAPQPLQSGDTISTTRYAKSRKEDEAGSPDVHKSSYFNPILLYPAKFAYQRETGLSQLERVLEERT